MKMLIVCTNCGNLVEAEVDGIIRTMLDCAEQESIYCGFFCQDCAEEMDDDY